MKYILRLACILIVFSTGCTKYLDAVPDKSLTIPTTIADYQALLENERMFMNAPALGEFGSDDLYLPDALWATQVESFKEGYRWTAGLNEGGTSPNWSNPYTKIYYANVVLDGVEKLKSKGGASVDLDVLKGWALFCRANAFYDLQEVFGLPYKPASASSDLGIPLKTGTNLEERVSRATVAQTFEQIVNDLSQAVQLLPAQPSMVNRSKPSKAAAHALMARVYLIMQDYNQAMTYAKRSLDLYSTLTDYNTIDATAKLPFSPLISEVIYNGIQLSYSNRYWEVDSQLYQSFKANDLRKVLFFTEDLATQSGIFRGYYCGVNYGFSGLVTDEVYFIKAECEARKGQDQQALTDVNTVLVKRFKTGTYSPYTIANTSNVLNLVLAEKRKECLFRGLRWSDLRRLNQDSGLAKTLTRTVNGVKYELPPNDPRYVMPIPDDEIRMSGIQQNIR